VDDRKRRLLDHGGLGNHHGSRLPIPQFEILDIRRLSPRTARSCENGEKNDRDDYGACHEQGSPEDDVTSISRLKTLAADAGVRTLPCLEALPARRGAGRLPSP